MQSKQEEYRLIRAEAHSLLEQQIRELTGHTVQISEMTRPLLTQIQHWQGRIYPWDWTYIRHKFWPIPSRFEMAISVHGRLCGLAIGNPSNGRRHLSAYYLEGNPDPQHPLKGMILPIVLGGLELYAKMLDCSYIRLVEPVAGLRPKYQSLGFSAVARVPSGALYCERKC